MDPHVGLPEADPGGVGRRLRQVDRRADHEDGEPSEDPGIGETIQPAVAAREP